MKTKTRKCLMLIVVLGLVFMVSGGCTLTEIKEASFTITSWDQEYYEYIGEWGLVEVYYQVTNTGNVDIDYYEVYFTVTCEDGSKYYDWTNGLNVRAGKTYSDYTYINTAGKKATSVKITDKKVDYHPSGCF